MLDDHRQQTLLRLSKSVEVELLAERYGMTILGLQTTLGQIRKAERKRQREAAARSKDWAAEYAAFS